MNPVELSKIENQLLEVLMRAAEELRDEHGWFFDNEGDPPRFDNPFFDVLFKHVSPLIDFDQYKKARIAALKKELEFLEEDLPQLCQPGIYTGKYDQLIQDLLHVGESESNIVKEIMKESRGHENPTVVKERIRQISVMGNTSSS